LEEALKARETLRTSGMDQLISRGRCMTGTFKENGLKKGTLMYVDVTLSLDTGLVRGMMGACDVIRVAAEFMVGRLFGSRYDGGV
jgi:hypothetical protein